MTAPTTHPSAFAARRDWLSEEGLRLDAAGYASGGLEARDRIVGGQWRTVPLEDIAQLFVESRFARTYVSDAAHGIPYMTASEMLLADLSDLRYLSLARTPQMHRLQVHEGWTLVSCSGTIGRTSYVRREMEGVAASHDVIRAAPRGAEVLPGYLFAFLSSAPAQAMIKQRTYGSVVQHIEPQHIADLPVPLLSEDKQWKVHDLVVRAAEARTDASRLLDEAASYFDSLAGPMPSRHDHARDAGIVRRDSLAGRLDAFHHVGWAAEAELLGDPLGSLADISVPNRMKLVLADRGLPFLTGVDVYQVRPRAEKRVARWIAESGGLVLNTRSILLQVDGQRYGLIGRPALAGDRLIGASASWHLARIVTSEWGRIFAFARSHIGRRAILRRSYGTSVPAISASQLSKVRVPCLPSEMADKAEDALLLREKADGNEEQAIREVETWVS